MASIIGIPLGGYVGDVIGRKVAVILSGSVVALGVGSFVLSPLAVTVVGYALVMLGTSLGSGPTQALLIESAPTGKRGSAMASPFFLPSLAGIPMPLLGAVASQAVGWPVVFGASTVLLVVSVVGSQLKLSETMESHGLPPKPPHSPRLSIVSRLAVLSPIALVVSVYLLDGLSEGSYSPFMPLYFTKFHQGLDCKWISVRPLGSSRLAGHDSAFNTHRRTRGFPFKGLRLVHFPPSIQTREGSRTGGGSVPFWNLPNRFAFFGAGGLGCIRRGPPGRLPLDSVPETAAVPSCMNKRKRSDLSDQLADQLAERSRINWSEVRPRKAR